jgi:hypothetical protein
LGTATFPQRGSSKDALTLAYDYLTSVLRWILMQPVVEGIDEEALQAKVATDQQHSSPILHWMRWKQ